MYRETKIYNDGSHYIAIPRTTNKAKRGKRIKEELITIVEEELVTASDSDSSTIESNNSVIEWENRCDTDLESETESGESQPKQEMQKIIRQTTRSEIFNKLYIESLEMPKSKRRKFIVDGMRKYFQSDKQTAVYVNDKLEKKRRSVICRRIRFTRKAYMHDFNYFVTLTYNNDIHTEESFKKKLKTCLNNFHNRKGWKYMGIWERSPKGRLHFHALFHIPNGTMPGELFNVRDYSLVTKRMQNTVQNTFFNKKFGRSDFEEIDKQAMRMGNAIGYLLKYIEKTGEKIVYSRGLPMYLISDIAENDVVTRIGLEDSKLLLFDNFICRDNGEYIGEISPEVKKRIRITN